jgi:hypothetical protein
MSEQIAVTLPNAVYDTLHRRMENLKASQIPGMKSNKSAYVATAIEAQLKKDGEEIVAEPKVKKEKSRLPIAIVTES